jgi:zinc protease
MLIAPRGTKTRSGQQIAEFFDSIGGDLGTAGGNNSWNWSATCLKDDLGKTLEVFADIVKNPTFPDQEVEMVKGRLLAAIEAQDADWFGQSMRFFRKTYFGSTNSPYQFMPTGTKETITAFTPAQVRQWYSDKILKSPRVLAIYGDIDVNQAKSLAAAQFVGPKQMNPPTAPAANAQPDPPAAPNNAQSTISVRRVVVNPSPNPQAGVIIGFDSRSVVGSPSLYPLTVADTMAGGYRYPTGYLFEVLRGRGLVYNVQAVIFPGRSEQYPGAFIVYAGCDPGKVNEVVEAILQNIARLQAGTPVLALDWFNRSKELIVTADALDNETAAAQATTAALDELFGLGYDYHAQFADNVKRVRIDQVTSTARRLLDQCVVTITTSAPQRVEVKEGPRRYNEFPPVELTPRGVQHDVPGAGK